MKKEKTYWYDLKPSDNNDGFIYGINYIDNKLVFWNEEEDCGNDTELGTELYEYIRNSLEDKSVVFHKNEDAYFGFIEQEVA
jgi:hypothetical protein